MTTTQNGIVTYLEDPYTARYVPPTWMAAGLQETSTGYGRRLNSGYVIRIAGETRNRRVYVVCFSNSGSYYIRSRGQAVYLRDTDLSVALGR